MLDDATRRILYALRCVDTVELGTAEQIGIGHVFLLALRSMGYLNGPDSGARDTSYQTFSLAPKGEEFMAEHGGSFAHRTSLRTYTPLANRRRQRSAADGYNG